MVVNFSRSALGQSGDGHFSPVASFHPGTNKCLVLDTARFKYPSYYVDVELLYHAMKPLDRESGRSRGYFLVQRKEPKEGVIQRSSLGTLSHATFSNPTDPDMDDVIPLCVLRNHDVRDTAWVRLARILCAYLPRALRYHKELHQPELSTTRAVPLILERILGSLPSTFELALSGPGQDQILSDSENATLRSAHQRRLQELIQQVRSQRMYTQVSSILSDAQTPFSFVPPVGNMSPTARIQQWAGVVPPPTSVDLTSRLPGDIAATLLLLAFPYDCLMHVLPSRFLSALESLRGSLHQMPGPLRFEVKRLRDQLHSLSEEYCVCRNKHGTRSTQTIPRLCHLMDFPESS